MGGERLALELDLTSTAVQNHHSPWIEPCEEDIQALGYAEAKRQRESEILTSAVKANRQGPKAQVYLNLVSDAKLMPAFERLLLRFDIEHSDRIVLEELAKNLLFFSLNCCRYLDRSIAKELCDRNSNTWLDVFLNGSADSSELLGQERFHAASPENLVQQTTCLLRRLFELSNGRVDCRQHNFPLDCTPDQNTLILASYLGIRKSRPFGHSDCKAMQTALSNSCLFKNFPENDIENTFNWARRMINMVPISPTDNQMNLPPRLLSKFGVKQVGRIMACITHAYLEFPSLKAEKNDMLILLIYSSTYNSQTIEVLRAWIQSAEGANLIQQLVADLWSRQNGKDFALALAALMTCEQLHSSVTEHDSPTVLEDFDALLRGDDLRNKRTILDRMTLSLACALRVVDVEDIASRLLSNVLEWEEWDLRLADDTTIDYCKERLKGRNHAESFRRQSEE